MAINVALYGEDVVPTGKDVVATATGAGSAVVTYAMAE
jgi:hypothetical protein